MKKINTLIKMNLILSFFLISILSFTACENTEEFTDKSDPGTGEIQELDMNASFEVIQSCGNVELSMKEIINSDKKKKFEAEVITENESPIKAEFLGIELKNALVSKGVDLSDVRTVSFYNGENYEYILEADELMTDDKCYLVYSVDNKAINSEEGPFQLIIKSEKSPHNRIKSANKIMLIKKGPG